MFCKNCGTQLKPGEHFCPFCGQKADSQPVQDSASKQNAPPALKLPQKKTIITTVCIIAVLVVACAVAILLTHRNTSDAEGKPLSNNSLTIGDLPEAASSSGIPEESTVVPDAPASLSGLYIGTWVAVGDILGDETNGWKVLYLKNVDGDTITFSLESVQASPDSRVATTYPVTVTISDNTGTFPVSDSWGNSGTGIITLGNGTIHIEVNITSYDQSSMWNIGMNADFVPDQPNSDTTASPAISLTPENSGSDDVSLSDLSDLYIGDWEGESCIIGDAINGWQALYIRDVDIEGQAITVSLEKIYPAPDNQILGIYDVEMPIRNGRCTFRLYDSMMNPIEGVLTLSDGAIHVKISNADPDARWDLSMDTTFYPRKINVNAGGKSLSLEKSPYMTGNILMVPLESVLKAVGVSVFEDDGAIVAMTENHILILEPTSGGFEYFADGEYDWNTTGLINRNLEEDGQCFVPLTVLDTFEIPYSWDKDTKTITISGEVEKDERISAELVEKLMGFTSKVALQQLQSTGYEFAAQGHVREYVPGQKSWSIPFLTTSGLKYAVVTYDGDDYQITERDYH